MGRELLLRLLEGGGVLLRVFSDGKRLLQRLIEGRWLQAHGVRRPNRCLADFIAPRSGPGARPDYIGLFAVTAGVGVEKKERQFLADHDGADTCRRWIGS